MPSINRIRICNLFYDRKRVLDLTMDTFGGNDALVLLANGSGKSVLLQMVLQPNLPGSSLRKRKVDSFLNPDGSPAYVVVEWLLDNTPTPQYFMTGVALCLKKGDPGEDKGSQNTVKFFTFTNKYEGADEYSLPGQFELDSLPLVKKEDNTMTVTSYNEAMAMFRSAKGIGYYNNDMERYREVLEEHGIFLGEWQIIARMNGEEGGIGKYFEDSKSSSSLIDNVIIKNIKGTLPHEDELQNMSVKMYEDIISHQNNIQERDYLSNFKVHLDGCIDRSIKIDEINEKANEVKRTLYELCRYSLNQKSKIDETICEYEKQTQTLISEKERVRHEEISLRHYQEQDRYNEYDEKHRESLVLEDEYKTKQEEAELNCKAYHARQFAEDMKEIKDNIAAGEMKLAKINNEIGSEEVSNLGYSLNYGYAREIEEAEAEIQAYKQEESDKTNEKEVCRKKKKEYTKQIQENTGRVSTLKAEYEYYEKEEENLLSRLGYDSIRFFFDKTLDLDAVRQIKEDFDQKRSECEEGIQTRAHQIERARKEKDDAKEQRENKKKELIPLVKERDNLYQRREDFKSYRDNLMKILERYNIQDSPETFSRTSLNEIKTQRDAISSDAKIIANRISKNEELLSDLERNLVHIPEGLKEYLDDAGIEYETGEEYLAGESETRRKALLKKNPALPFSYIVPQKDYGKTVELKVNDPITRVIPIITFESLENDMNPVGRSVEWEGGLLICSYEEKCFDSKMKEEFKASLYEDLKDQRDVYKEKELVLQRANKDIETAENYNYDPDYGDRLERDIRKTEEDIATLEDAIKKLEEKIDHIPDEIEAFNKEKYQMESSLRDILSEQGKFERHLEGDEEYCTNRSECGRLEKEIEAAMDEIAKLEQKEQQYENYVSDTKDKIYKAEKRLDILIGKSGRFSEYKEGTLLSGNMSELEKKYDAITSRYEDDRETVEKELLELRQKLGLREKSSQVYSDVPIEHQEKIILSPDTLSSFEERKEKYKGLASEQEEITKRYRDKVTWACAQMEGIAKDLEHIGKSEYLPRSVIKLTDFKAREEALKNKEKEIDRARKEAEKEGTLYIAKATRIRDTVGDIPVAIVLTKTDAEYDAYLLDDLIDSYNKQNQAELKAKDELQREYLRIKSEFGGKSKAIENILFSMSDESGGLTGGALGSITEGLTFCSTMILDLIASLDALLESYDKNKENIVNQALFQGQTLLKELRQLCNSSKVRINGNGRLQQMIDITLPDTIADDAVLKERMARYIDSCIDRIIEKCEGKDNPLDIVNNQVKTDLSSRRLLDVITDNKNLDVMLYKVDVDMDSGEMRKWEDAIICNSGAQEMVACFALLSALVDHSRKNILVKRGGDPNEAAKAKKVFVMDNPFGPNSSEHSVGAFVNIAKRFGFQIICFTDIDKSTVTGYFPVIYQLALRKAKYSNHSIMNIENIEVVNRGSEMRMEGAYVRSEQVRLGAV